MIEGKLPGNRLKLVWVLAYVITFIFLFKLMDIQLVNTEKYRALAEKNRTQILTQSAPRGRIFSEDNKALATNKPSFSLIYFPNEKISVSLAEKMAMAISKRLEINPDTIKNILKNSARREKPVRLAENLSDKEMLLMSELKAVYPGLEIIVEAKRFYPYGAYLTHLIGYTGKIDGTDWEKLSLDKNYSMDSLTGKSGLEKMYERELKGKDGGIYLEVDYRGRMSRVLESRKWIPGSDIYLTINSLAQTAAENGLKKSISKKGAVVAIDPRNGALLAFASMPDYDLNKVYDPKYREKKPVFSEFNVALQGTYPPGSIFKIISSAAILESGKVNKEDTFKCTGSYDAGSRIFKCWDKKGHGKVDYIKGLAKSCDVYYYMASQKAGPLSIEKYARSFRLGMLSGIDLPYEKRGNVFGPSIRAEKKSYWFIGDTLNLSIGQGETLMTPIQAAQMIAAIANDGFFYRPYYINKIVRPDGQEVVNSKPEILSTVSMKPETLELIREALLTAVEQGTGYMSQVKGLKIYGKTGTAQNPHGDDHAWFVAYATYNNEPAKVAVAVLVEHGEHGATEAAPIAKSVIEAVLEKEISEYNTITEQAKNANLKSNDAPGNSANEKKEAL